MNSLMKNCSICPRKCGVDRTAGRTGYCKVPAALYAARADLHMWEEPCITGTHGSGAVFFSGCNLGCVFCQNHHISGGEVGKEITLERLAEIFLELQNEKHAENINLVTATHYVPAVAEALKLAKKAGLRIPVIYNTSGYESVETLRMLERLVDVYLPDFKYVSEEYAARYSKAGDYPAVAKKALHEMMRQVGSPVFRDDLLVKGMVVRHLVLPGLVEESKAAIRYLYETYGDEIFISIMNQFTPVTDLSNFPELDRTLSQEEYDEVVDYAIEIGVENGFIQEGETAKDSFIPEFDITGI